MTSKDTGEVRIYMTKDEKCARRLARSLRRHGQNGYILADIGWRMHVATSDDFDDLWEHVQQVLFTGGRIVDEFRGEKKDA